MQAFNRRGFVASSPDIKREKERAGETKRERKPKKEKESEIMCDRKVLKKRVTHILPYPGRGGGEPDRGVYI